MNQCLRAAESMFNMPIQPPTITPLKRKSIGDIGDHAPKKQVLGSPGEASPYAIPRNVSTQSPGLGQPVNIQPRPNGFPPPTLPPNAPITPISQSVVLPPRRRGRPPKAETLARQSAPQTAHYTPISPAPIVPSPIQAIAPRPQSPGPAYQVWPAAPPDPKSKKKGRQTASDKQLPPPETVPRTLQSAPGSETGTRQTVGPSAEYVDWRERTSGREPAQRPSVLAARELSRELPLPPISPSMPPPRSPQPPLEPGTQARETPTTTSLEQTRQGGHMATVN